MQKRRRRRRRKDKESHTHQAVGVLFTRTTAQLFPILHLVAIVFVFGSHALKDGLRDGVDLAHASRVHVRRRDGGFVGRRACALVPRTSEMVT